MDDERISALEAQVAQLTDTVLYHRVIAKAQINVLMNWVTEASELLNLDKSDQESRLLEGTRLAIHNILSKMEEVDPGRAARFLALDPANDELNDLLRNDPET
jgi:hypothetical protein